MKRQQGEKTMKANKTLWLIGVLILCACSGNGAEANVCNGDAGVGIARAYAIAISYPDSLPQFVKNNPDLFRENGPSIICGRTLVTELRKAVLKGPDIESIKGHAMDVATRAGAPELGPKLGEDMAKGSADVMQLAFWLEELVNTIPSLLQDDPKPYSNTSIYQYSKFMWTFSEGLLLPDDLKRFRDMMQEANEWIVTSLSTALPE
jgi:hypothetical protein